MVVVALWVRKALDLQGFRKEAALCKKWFLASQNSQCLHMISWLGDTIFDEQS